MIVIIKDVNQPVSTLLDIGSEISFINKTQHGTTGTSSRISTANKGGGRPARERAANSNVRLPIRVGRRTIQHIFRVMPILRSTLLIDLWAKIGHDLSVSPDYRRTLSRNNGHHQTGPTLRR